MSKLSEMESAKREEMAQGCTLAIVLSIAVVAVAVAVGLFFGAQWGAAVIAAFAVLVFARMRYVVKREREKGHGDEA